MMNHCIHGTSDKRGVACKVIAGDIPVYCGYTDAAQNRCLKFKENKG